MMGEGGAMGFGGGFMWLLWIVLIVLVVLAVKGFVNTGENSETTDAREILKQRLAKGEIDEQEYKDKLKTLEN